MHNFWHARGSVHYDPSLSGQVLIVDSYIGKNGPNGRDGVWVDIDLLLAFAKYVTESPVAKCERASERLEAIRHVKT